MATRYEVRFNAETDGHADEWSVVALAENCHARTVLTTTDKHEAYTMAAAFDMKAALVFLVANFPQDWQSLDSARAAIARCDPRPKIAR